MVKALELPDPSAPGLKICYRCREEKPFSDFCKNKSRADGLGPYCKECEKEKREALKARGYFEEYAKKNRERLNKKAVEYYWKNPEKAREKNRVNNSKPERKQKIAEYNHAHWLRTRDDPEWRAKRAAQARNYRLEHQEEHRLDSARQRAKFADEAKANSAANHAIRDGKLKREPCEACGKEPAQAHHDDYNYPLKVRWLCKDCHARWHRDNEPIRKRKDNI